MLHKRYFFKKSAHPGLFFAYFCFFLITISIIQMEKSTIGRAVASGAIGPRFKSIHQQFYKENSLLLPVKKTKIKIKMKEMSNFLTTSLPPSQKSDPCWVSQSRCSYVCVRSDTYERTDGRMNGGKIRICCCWCCYSDVQKKVSKVEWVALKIIAIWPIINCI